MSDALVIARFRTPRGSAKLGEPSGWVMSQNMRAVPRCCWRQGSSWKVLASGRATMSDS